jgi:hypothetical protein
MIVPSDAVIVTRSEICRIRDALKKLADDKANLKRSWAQVLQDSGLLGIYMDIDEACRRLEKKDEE